MLLCFIVSSLNFVVATNETQVVDDTLYSIDDSNLEIPTDEFQKETVSIENCQNLFLEPSKTIEITQDNYENYFDIRTGKILSSANISKGDTLKIGNISERAFVIDRQLTLMPISPDDEISNGFIHLIKGSDGSTIVNLTINNTKNTLTIKGVTVGQLHGIWLSNSNNNLIAYNKVRIANSGGVYALPMGWSSNNRIIYNDMKTYISSNIIMGESHYNLISHNSLEVLSYSDLSVTNLIYFNPFGHADYYGSPLCKGNIISYNYLKGFCTLPMSIILQFQYANHDGTIVANNTIIKGSFGVNLCGNNVSVYGNKVLNSAIGISANGENVTVHDNDVSGDSQNIGIQVSGTANSQCTVFNNNITFIDVSSGVSANGNVNLYDNNININGYGIGISVNGNNSNVFDNNVKNNHDSGISILGNYNLIDNNIVNTNSIGVNVPAETTGLRYYNNTIINNKITSEKYGVSIEGLVYNSVITDNVIETNATSGINMQITDDLSNTELDNIVNGVILNSTSIVVNDDNYDQYFDEWGYLKYEFPENKTKVIILTFLSNKNLHFDDKINVISNSMDNLLFNVTITFEADGEGSLIRDFNFVNYDKMAIVVDGIDDLTVTNNNITCIFKDGQSDSAILIQDVCENGLISNNNIYVNSKLNYAYAINAPSFNPSNGRFNKKFSNGFDVVDNTIIMISTGVGEGVYTDTLANSNFVNNKINIISDGYAYGLAFASIIGRLSGLNVSCNEIVIHSKQMAYLVEGYMIDNSTISNNHLYSESTGVYGIGIYRSNNISIENNDIHVLGGELKNIESVDDTLGIGNAAIAVIKDTLNSSIINNSIYSNVSIPIFNVDCTNESALFVNNNNYIIDDDNYGVYFTKKGKISSVLLENNSTVLLGNVTGEKIMDISSPIILSSVDKGIPAAVQLTLNRVSGSKIYGISFVNSTITLKGSSNVIISDNIFESQKSNVLSINSGKNNTLINNSFNVNSEDVSVIELIKSQYNSIKNNLFEVNGSVVRIVSNSACNYNLIENNLMNALADDLIFIYSYNSRYDNITQNKLSGNASSIFGYYASKVNFGHLSLNNIEITGGGDFNNQSGIFYTDASYKNDVEDNHIVSNSVNANDYAVCVISDKNLLNSITKNYLISSNSLKIADNAVYAPFDNVYMNTPMDIYVSVYGDDILGDGSEYRPYASISKAINESFGHVTIYINDGYFNESDISIDKNITLVAINPGRVTLDAGFKQLFSISENSQLSVVGLIIQNAHNENGGSVFINNGKLNIRDSVIRNSSSYYDNSNPTFDHDIEYGYEGQIQKAHTYNCSESGKGGVILNNGEVKINSSVFYGNLGHIGGVIADYGMLWINSSLFYNNYGVHGGVIYAESGDTIMIENSLFTNNTALTTLDYCALRMVGSVWSIDEGYRYSYYSDCSVPLGVGGVIYTKDSDVKLFNSTFISNSAKSGGVIATQIDSFSSTSNFNSEVDLQIDDCYFKDNRANDTRRSLRNNDLNNYNYYSGFDGGVVYGTFNKCYLNNSEFYYNQATNNGGVLYAKSNDGKIFDCIFVENLAGTSGGALDISKNFIIMRSVISNNTARYGGAIEYDSNSYYGHILNNLNIYNSTISNNVALNQGGAFNIGSGNITVRDSNIVNNMAPTANTIHSSGSYHAIDMRNNYWGNEKGPDDSVWKVNNLDFRPWYRQWIHWEPTVIEDDPSEPVEVIPGDDSKPQENPDSGKGNSGNSNPVSTGSSTSTGTSIGGNGNAEGIGYGDTSVSGTSSGTSGGNGDDEGIGHDDTSDSGKGNEPGDDVKIPIYDDGQEEINNDVNTKYYGSGDGNNIESGSINRYYDSLPGNGGYSGQKVSSSQNSSSNVVSQVEGTVNSDSMSKSNSSDYNADLASVGMVSNAVSVSSSASGKSDGGVDSSSRSTSESSVSKAYELDEKIDEILDDGKSMLSFIALAIVVLSLLIIGYKRKEHENEE